MLAKVTSPTFQNAHSPPQYASAAAVSVKGLLRFTSLWDDNFYSKNSHQTSLLLQKLALLKNNHSSQYCAITVQCAGGYGNIFLRFPQDTKVHNYNLNLHEISPLGTYFSTFLLLQGTTYIRSTHLKNKTFPSGGKKWYRVWWLETDTFTTHLLANGFLLITHPLFFSFVDV